VRQGTNRVGLTVCQPRRGSLANGDKWTETGQPRQSEPRHGHARGSRDTDQGSLSGVLRRPRRGGAQDNDDRPLPLQHRALREVACRDRPTDP
jgi:hypothetical protein